MPGYPCPICCSPSTVPASTNQCIHCPSSEAPDGYVFDINGVGPAASTYCSTDFCNDINSSFAVDGSTLGLPTYCSGTRNVGVCCRWTQAIDYAKYFNLFWDITSGTTHNWKLRADIVQTIYYPSSVCSTIIGSGNGVTVHFESTEFSSTTKCHELSNYAMTYKYSTGVYIGSSEACDFSSITLSLSAY